MSCHGTSSELQSIKLRLQKPERKKVPRAKMVRDPQLRSIPVDPGALAAGIRPLSVSVSVQPLAVNVLDAARVVGVPPFTIREAIGNGSLPARRAGRTYIIPLHDLQVWLETLDEASLSPCFLKRAECRKKEVA